jgi:hypothetical protein
MLLPWLLLLLMLLGLLLEVEGLWWLAAAVAAVLLRWLGVLREDWECSTKSGDDRSQHCSSWRPSCHGCATPLALLLLLPQLPYPHAPCPGCQDFC